MIVQQQLANRVFFHLLLSQNILKCICDFCLRVKKYKHMNQYLFKIQFNSNFIDKLLLVNTASPTFQNATGLNSTSIGLEWDTYSLQYWNAPSMEFVLLWKELEPVLEDQYHNSINISGGVLLTDPLMSPTSWVFSGLRKFANYSFLLTTRNEVGVSTNYTEIICATLDDGEQARRMGVVFSCFEKILSLYNIYSSRRTFLL